MKNKFTFLLYLLFPIAVTFIASGFGNTPVTVGAFIVSLLLLAFFLRADLLMLMGMHAYQTNRSKGFVLMEHAMKTGKLRPKSRLLYAYLLVRNGELDEAERIINKTTYLGKDILKDADFKTAEFNLALIDWKRGRLADAIMKAEKLYSEGYLNGNLYGTLGYFYIANNEIDKAIELSKEAVEYSPDDLICRDNLGQAYIISGELDKAQEIYGEVLKRDPEFIEPYYNYATLLEKRAELADAADYYRKALTYPQKYLSTVTHEQVEDALARVEELLK